MWLATKNGFFSIVKREDGVYHIRARSIEDLVELRGEVPELEGLSITETTEADYIARICFTDPETLSGVMSHFAKSIDYGNFKNMIHERESQEDKLTAYSRIWGIMYNYQNL
jgi:hypothetical protein